MAARGRAQELNDFGHYPFGCAVDPKTENVAVANYASTLKLGPGSVSIFDGGKGVPHSYQDSAFNAYFFCGYDNKSDLFVDGADYGSYHTLLAEIPAGKSTFTNIAPDQTIGYPGGVQWDGTYLTVGDAPPTSSIALKFPARRPRRSEVRRRSRAIAAISSCNTGSTARASSFLMARSPATCAK